MKKLLLAFFILAICTTGLFAAMQNSTAVHTSGSTSATIVLPADATRIINLYDITARSDKSGSFIDIFTALPATTPSYTQKVRLNLGASTVFYGGVSRPLFICPKGYQMKVTCDSTTADTLILDYEYQLQ